VRRGWVWFGGWLFLLGLAAVLVRLSDRAAWPTLSPLATETLCLPQAMRPVSERYPRSVATSPSGFLLTLPVVLEGAYCQSGELTLRAEPAGTGEVPAVMSLSSSGRPLLSRVIRIPQTVTIPIRTPSRISVAFLNQTYELDARTVTFLQVLPKGRAQCRGSLEGKIPVASGTWQRIRAQGRLYGGDPLQLSMCGVGSLLLRLQGQASGGSLPRLRFGGVTPGRDVTVPKTLYISVPVTKRGILTVQLVNPRSTNLTNTRLLVQPTFRAQP
jgi:hypothetical protein